MFVEINLCLFEKQLNQKESSALECNKTAMVVPLVICTK